MTAGFLLARALTDNRPAQKLPLTVRAAGAGTISVEATPHTLTPGTWGVRLDHGGHLQVRGRPTRQGDHVIWRLSSLSTPPAVERRGVWTGIAHQNPSAAGLTAADELIVTRAGVTPAWRIGQRHSSEKTWAVHVHGAGSSRAGTLRGVLATSEAGIPSLVATYRNTTEGPRVGRGRSHLGSVESADIDDVLAHLERQGAERFVLFGWSMGAQVILPLAASERWKSAIAAVVLDSPVLNWRHTLQANLRMRKLPAGAARLAEGWLTGARRARMVGMDQPLHLDEMDWLRRSDDISAPVLVHHGRADTTTPISDSRQFVRLGVGRGLSESEAGHTVGWNIEPDRWHDTTVRFLADMV